MPEPPPAHRPVVAVCMKWVALRPEVDPLTGDVQVDDRFAGASPADQAALEWALRASAAWGATVTVATLGPPAADAMLRDALACGAHRAIRIDTGGADDPDGADQPTSEATARALAAVLRAAASGKAPALTLCGDWSLDRGTASVPPFLAHELGVAQACGLVALDIGGEVSPAAIGTLRVERRLDGGRRERLAVTGPAVLSVEGATARLRRAPLAAVLSAQRATIEVVSAPHGRELGPVVRTGPFRPRARILAGPDPQGDPLARIIALTGALRDRTPPQRLTLDPAAAAARILEQVRAWGYD